MGRRKKFSILIIKDDANIKILFLWSEYRTGCCCSLSPNPNLYPSFHSGPHPLWNLLTHLPKALSQLKPSVDSSFTPHIKFISHLVAYQDSAVDPTSPSRSSLLLVTRPFHISCLRQSCPSTSGSLHLLLPLPTELIAIFLCLESLSHPDFISQITFLERLPYSNF